MDDLPVDPEETETSVSIRSQAGILCESGIAAPAFRPLWGQYSEY